ncbi:MAG: rhomboid family intramembrane serine protease [bacterium]|nr:rhomboid family intramembrane serine protease [bacterium]
MVLFVGGLWVIELINALQDHAYNSWGILPRVAVGLRGIAFAPFLHADVEHLALNSVPLAILGWLVLLRGTGVFLRVSVSIAVLSGLGVWCFGRMSYHIGASGLILGYFGYLVARGFYERSWGALLVAIVTAALYGGMVTSVFPSHPGVSWESHLFGLLAGVAAARAGTQKAAPRSKRAS